ncbi:MAG: hypothetical protein U1D55_05985 [Phycisphaerae bacterium]
MVQLNRELIEALELEEIEEARRMRPADKLALGGILFDDMVRRMADGIRKQFPELDAVRTAAILEERLDADDRREPGD